MTRARRPASPPTRTPLTPARIAEAALALVDEAGLEGCTMRRLGAELGVEAMALYHHYPGKGPLLEEGMVLAVEPMTTAGRHMVRMGDDGWAIYSQDGSLAAHFEFTIAITADGPRILTPWHVENGE